MASIRAYDRHVQFHKLSSSLLCSLNDNDQGYNYTIKLLEMVAVWKID